MVRKLKNKKKHQRIIFIITAFLISSLALIFILINFKNNIVFFYSPSELKQVQIPSSKIIRVGGLIKEGSVVQNKEDGLIFIITDLENDLTIQFYGIKPDLFREGQGMIAKGRFDTKNNIFLADELLAKHDENYMPPEVKKSLKDPLKN